MTSARAYRSALPSSVALRELWRCAGTQFHAEIVGALANAVPGVTSNVEDEVLDMRSRRRRRSSVIATRVARASRCASVALIGLAGSSTAPTDAR